MLFPILAAVLLVAIGWALARRRVVASTEGASAGRVVVHDGTRAP
jgi:hypothetical protein